VYELRDDIESKEMDAVYWKHVCAISELDMARHVQYSTISGNENNVCNKSRQLEARLN
jgi:hypothetical protein